MQLDDAHEAILHKEISTKKGDRQSCENVSCNQAVRRHLVRDVIHMGE